MFTAIISGYRFLYLQLASVVGYGWAIVVLSFVCSALMLPLMRAVAGIVRREKEYEDVIDPQVAAIKAKYESDMDRHFHIQALYQRYGYSPLAPIKKVMPLFVQIPFLLLTYYMLKGTSQLSGISFFFLKDLGQPDALIAGINLLPLVMTGVNILTVFATPGFSHKDWTQAIAISLLFLVLLYTAPSALLLYWTLNNTITFVRTLCEKRFAGAMLLTSRLNPMLYLRWLCTFLKHFSRVVRIRVSNASVAGVSTRAFLGFFVINAFFVAPLLLVLLYRAPKNFEIRVLDSDAVPLISVGFDRISADRNVSTEYIKRLRSQRADDGMLLLQDYFADSEFVERAVLKIESNSRNVRVASITITRFDCLSHVLTPVALVKGYQCRSGEEITLDREGYAAIPISSRGVCELVPKAVSGPNWGDVIFEIKGKFLPRICSAHLCLFEIAILIFSALCSIFVDRRTSIRTQIGFSLCLAILFVLQIVYLAPIRIYLPNAGAFPISMTELLVSLTWVGLVAMVGLSLGLWLSHFTFGYLLHCTVLSFLAYEYLQMGVLSSNEPSFNGVLAYYLQRSLLIRDMVVMAVSIGAVMLLFVYARKKLAFAIALLFAMNVSSLLGIKVAPKTEEDVGGKCSLIAAARSFQPSRVKNVLLFVLDSCSTEVISDVLNRNTCYKEVLEGFTMYQNNIGMHHETDIATVGMLTGLYYRGCNDKSQLVDHMKLPFSTGALMSYLDSDFNISIVPSAYPFGVARPMVNEDALQKQDKGSSLFRRLESGTMSLYEYTKFRLSPYALKIPMYYLIRGGMENKIRVGVEADLYRLLAAAPHVSSKSSVFGFFHTYGAHGPHDVNADGVRIDGIACGYEAYYNHALFCMKELIYLLSEMKKRDWYDNSYIIVAADHGPHDFTDSKTIITDGDVLPQRARPFIMIKPMRNRTPFAYDGTTPTSHAKIHTLLQAVLEHNVTAEETRKILRKDDGRVFILTTLEGYKEWHVDADGRAKDFIKYKVQ